MLTSGWSKATKDLQAACDHGEPVLGYRRLKDRGDFPGLLRTAYRRRNVWVGGWPEDVYSSFARYSEVRGNEWDYDWHDPGRFALPIHYRAGIISNHPYLSREEQRAIACHHLVKEAEALAGRLERIVRVFREDLDPEQITARLRIHNDGLRRDRLLEEIISDREAFRLKTEYHHDLAFAAAWIRGWAALGFGFLAW